MRPRRLWRRSGIAAVTALLLVAGVAAAPAALATTQSTKPEHTPVPVPAAVRNAVAAGPADVLVAIDPSAGLARIRTATQSQLSAANRQAAVVDAAAALSQVKRQVSTAAGSGVHVQRDYQHLPVQVMRVDSAAALAALAAAPGVTAVQLPGVMHTQATPNLELIGQPAASASGYTGAGVTVAVLDTGIDIAGSGGWFGDCSGGLNTGTCKVRSFTDTTGGSSTVGDVDPGRHGTNVAGLATAVAPAAKVAVYRVFQSDGAGGVIASDTSIFAALDDVAAQAGSANIRAANLSLGSGGNFNTVCTGSPYGPVFLNLRALGVLPAVAAGNNFGTDGVSSPACADGAFAVGAVMDRHLPDDNDFTSWIQCGNQTVSAPDAVACFSQSGDRLDLLAPGLLVTAAGVTESGTSQATPHVAGAVAALASARPNATTAQIDNALRTTGPLITDPREPNLRKHRLDIPAAAARLISAGPPAVVTTAGCTTNTFPANDDGSTAAVNLPFVMNFYGTSYSQLFVNNNGNVTFQEPNPTFTPFTIAANVPPIIAPFFGDVDTRGAGSDVVRYGVTTFGSRTAFCVNWVNVGYYEFHTDKLNSFQLLLVDRGDIGAGDFDIVMNYDTLLWETGDASGGSSGYGGTPAGGGYSAGDGNPAHFFQLPGSLSSGALLDGNLDTGLVNGSRNSLQTGRYVFPIRNGVAPGAGILTGVVRDADGFTQSGATVQACPTSGSCLIGFSGPNGIYTIVGADPGSWTFTAFPPSGSGALPGHAGPATLPPGSSISVDITLGSPQGPPPGTTITDHGTTGSVPIIYWQDNLTLETNACANGTVTYQMTLGGNVIRSGPMVQTAPGSGHYVATIPAVFPLHGDAQVSVHAVCPGGNQDINFDIYIDPSGTVTDTHGNPIAGATVTLLRADTEAGPFVPVPGGSAVMSPSNRTNPWVTAADGAFHWDVLAGEYRVSASKAGCHAPGTADVEAITDVFEIPPAALGIQIRLDCDPPVPGAFVTLPPSRILDTRNANGVPTTTAVPAFGTVSLQVTGRGGVPASGGLRGHDECDRHPDPARRLRHGRTRPGPRGRPPRTSTSGSARRSPTWSR